jgi:cytochrome c peroxidase
MKRRVLLLSAIVVATVIATSLWRRPAVANAYVPRTPVAATVFRVAFETDLDLLSASLDSLQTALHGADASRQLHWYQMARSRYKRVEGLVELLAPGVSGVLNGPLPDDDGDAPPRELGAPAAFQRVEAALVANDLTDQAAGDVAMMRKSVSDLRGATQFVALDLGDVLDATRLEIARVTTLGLAGVDAGIANNPLLEAADALDGIRSQLSHGSPRMVAVDSTLRDAIRALRGAQGFDDLDRLRFIVQYATPAARAVGAARLRARRSITPRRQVWRDDAASVFDRDALDASAYAPEFAPRASAELIALGRRMFFDPTLSGPKTRSCASCHAPDKAFADGRVRAIAIDSSASAVSRNTPTLLNAALQPLLFADQRAKSLEDQVAQVLISPAEMGSSASIVAARLSQDTSYPRDFRRALRGWSDSSVSELSVRVALAAYVRSLTALDSRFDRAVRGDTLALSAQERAGFTLFQGKARCGTCHFAPLFNGTVPPDFVSSEPERIGVPTNNTSRSAIDPDAGRFAADHIEQHRFAFKVPTLRNVALTAPYMHNGVYATLEQVVDFYNRGGGAALGTRHPALTLDASPLHLTPPERQALVAFMRALTDTSQARR